MKRYIRKIILQYGSLSLLMLPNMVSGESLVIPTDEFSLNEGYESHIPQVLHVTRMHQPRSEVPGSVTLITAEQIHNWGVRTVPELMRFVPGVFVKHGSSDTLAYHASNPNLMRRLQVLVNGRSVYRAGIASVVWEHLPVAIEDIQRIEVVRGPNSSSYGANAFMGTVNIITFDPMDTLGSRMLTRLGNQTTRDFHLSHSNLLGAGAFRVTAESKSDDGFDGQKTPSVQGEDQFNDSTRHRFLNLYYSQHLADDSQLFLEASYMSGVTDPEFNSNEIAKPVEHNKTGSVYARLNKSFSPKHSAHLQGYWQKEVREKPSLACVPTVAFDPELYQLYDKNPYWAHTLGRLGLNQEQLYALASGALPPEYVEAELEGATGRDFTIDQADLDIAQSILLRTYNGQDLNQYYDLSCGSTDENYSDQRIDIEWQDTIYWSDRLRTVSGISFRQDLVNSDTYFKGIKRNNIYRAFATIEWSILDKLNLTLAGMYEHEDNNISDFSPRVALNYILTPSQSFRLVYSSAVRSPDFLEQTPQYSYLFTHLDENYLGLEEGVYYAHHDYANRGLNKEEIRSLELGYYASLTNVLSLDIKLYKDRLFHLISNPINLVNPTVNSDQRMDIEGIDWQFKWNLYSRHSLLWSGAYVDADVELGDTSSMTQKEIDELAAIETTLSAQYSNNLNWVYSSDTWSMSHSYFWHTGYKRDSRTQDTYRRYEFNWNKEIKLHQYEASLGLFWHHLIDKESFLYDRNNYSADNLYFLKLGLEF